MLKIIFFIFTFLFPNFALASLKVIRDSETENFLREVSDPIFIQAGLDPESIQIHIVNDQNLNAFVAGGRNLFINSGLIIKAESLDALIGVIAHETGHIAGGHLVKLTNESEAVSTSMAVGYILGIATALSGSPDVGQALLLGSSHVAERSMLSFSRNHEDAADEAALKYMNNLKIDPNGMLDFFEQIKTQEAFSSSNDIYTRSHPLTNARILRIKSRIAKYGDVDYSYFNDSELENFKLIQTKLECFLVKDPERLIQEYDSNEFYDWYGRAILYHRMGDMQNALKNINVLITEFPDNRYFIETKAQFYYENGNAMKALEFYQITSDMAPKDVLVKIQIAESIISLENSELYPRAINELNEAILIEHDSVIAWNKLSLLYKRQNKDALSKLSLAEAKYYSGKYEQARLLSETAIADFEKQENQSRNIQRAKEIIEFANRNIKSN
jgi:predicted Zn-dependent protease